MQCSDRQQVSTAKGDQQLELGRIRRFEQQYRDRRSKNRKYEKRVSQSGKCTTAWPRVLCLLQSICRWLERKPPNFFRSSRLQNRLLHQEQCAGLLDGFGHAALVMRGQPGVLARQDAPVACNKCLQQFRVAILQLVDGEIDYRFRAWWTLLVRVSFFFVLLLWHII